MTETKNEQQTYSFKRKLGNTTYTVKVHFSRDTDRGRHETDYRASRRVEIPKTYSRLGKRPGIGGKRGDSDGGIYGRY